jgi:hypothetical protein
MIGKIGILNSLAVGLVHCFTYIGRAAGDNFGLGQGAKEEHIRCDT